MTGSPNNPGRRRRYGERRPDAAIARAETAPINLMPTGTASGYNYTRC
jgi:hypothetical protein